MKPDPPFVSTHTDREEVARELREHDLLAIPVVDAEQRLVGTITHDDVADIMEREATEDIYRFGAVSGTERGYFASRIFSVVRRRGLWLLLLIAVNTVTGAIIARQELRGELLILAAFIPLLIGTGGNVGAQSATVVIRGLATGEVKPRRALAVVLREVGIGALLGIVLGAVALGWAYMLGGNQLQVAIIVSTTLVAISVMATLVGGALPFIFRLLKIDPALVSAPFITTIMDIFGVAVYFGIAYMVLRL
jgi:magnesium transporter